MEIIPAIPVSEPFEQKLHSNMTFKVKRTHSSILQNVIKINL